MKTSPLWPAGARRAGLALGLVASVVFVALTAHHLEAQGPYYDELHQATGAFTWLGVAPAMFCRASWRGACLLNMSYSGAIKTNLYGAYLRFGPRHFSLWTWRLYGIVPVALAIVVFSVLAFPVLSAGPLAVFLALLVTDVNVLLGTRFDAGPVALALAARLLLIGLWLRGHVSGAAPSTRNSVALGAVVGLSILEKLSSVVLLVVLVAAWLGDGRRPTARHLWAMATGLAVGAVPLVVINLLVFATHGGLVSLADVFAADRPSPGWLRHGVTYLALGQGARVREWILGLAPNAWAIRAEVVLIAVVVALIVTVAVRSDAPRRLRLAGTLTAVWGAIAIALWLLPRRVAVHHLVIGTPFQYAAVAVALAALAVVRAPAARAVRLCLVALLAVWIGLRLVSLWPVETHLARGAAGPAWDPSLRELGHFAAARRDTAVFVASDWGVGTQIYCFADGSPRLIYEPFSRYRGVSQLHELQRRSGKDTLYLVRLSRPVLVNSEATRRIEHDLATDPGWREVEIEPDARDLRAVSIRKFVYRLGLSPS